MTRDNIADGNATTPRSAPGVSAGSMVQRMVGVGRSGFTALGRRVAKRRLIVPVAAVLAAAVIAPIDLVSAAVTGRSTVFANQFITDASAEDPYGLHNASLAPASGRSFVDRASGQVTFALFSAATPPTPYPAVASGDRIEIITELPPSLRVSTTHGWCDPSFLGEARNYVAASCETTERADGSSTVRTTLTAKVALTRSVHWRALKSHTIGVIAKDGQIEGSGSGHIVIAFPDDADHVRNRSADLPFTTTVGTASGLSARNGDVVPDSPTDEPNFTWYAGERGYVTFETGFTDPTARGVTMKTGESFTYTLDQIAGRAPRSLVLDETPAEGSVFENACALVVPGYDIRCQAVDGTVQLVTTRTGPDVVDDKPMPGKLAIPLMHPEGVGDPRLAYPRVTLAADMEQLGSDALVTRAQDTTLSRHYRPGLGVNDLAVTPYVGHAFSAGGEGRLTFDFVPEGAPINQSPMMQTGDEVTMTVNLGDRFTVHTEESGPGQGDASRNWCDMLDVWNPELDGYLGDPLCTALMDEDTADIIVTVRVTALQDVYQDRLQAGFQIRVRSSPAEEDAVKRISAEISSTRQHAVVAPLRRAEAEVRTIDSQTSSLGVWRAEARTASGAVGEPPAGHVSWFSDPSVDAPGFWPFSVETGDTLTYRIDLPEGLAYPPTPADGAADVCALPDRYLNYTGSCVIDGSSIEYTLTRTGPPEQWDVLDKTLPFTIPVVHTSADGPVEGDVEITLSTSIVQSGSANRRAIVPVQTPVPNGYGLHDTTLTPFDGDAFVDHSTGVLDFNLYAGASAPESAPSVKKGEQIVVTADLPASLEFTDAFGWCDPDGTLPEALDDFASTACDVTDHPDGSSTLRLTWTARLDLPTAPAFWAFYFVDSQIGVVAREGQVAGTGTARMTITFPDDAGHSRVRIAEPTFKTAVGDASTSPLVPEVPVGPPVIPDVPVAPSAVPDASVGPSRDASAEPTTGRRQEPRP